MNGTSLTKDLTTRVRADSLKHGDTVCFDDGSRLRVAAAFKDNRNVTVQFESPFNVSTCFQSTTEACEMVVILKTPF